jgi:adenosylcobyric acid synthase
MLGRTIDDAVESGAGTVAGLGLLPAAARFEATKVTRPRTGRATLPGAPTPGRGAEAGHPVSGYQIHHGRLRSDAPWITLADGWGTEAEGAADATGRVVGTSLHGLFETDGFRAAFLAAVAARRGKAFVPSGLSFTAAREEQFDLLADVLEAHLDMTAVECLIAQGATVPVPTLGALTSLPRGTPERA